MATRHASFAPVVDGETQTLILGSLPGAASLAARRYYAHPQNQFWRLVGALIGIDLGSLDYEQRLVKLLEHHVGLWDVIADAERAGSLDAAIRNHAPNDLQALANALPRLRTIGFNGATAARIGSAQLGSLGRRFRLIPLPSSSPAHARLSFEQKLDIWGSLFESRSS